MEFFIVMISVPLFLLILLLFALVVLPRYPRRTRCSSGGEALRDKGPTSMAAWGLTLLLYAAFVVAMISAFKLDKEK